MKFRAIDSLGDWTFGSGKANYATDERAIELNIQTRIRSWKNDCFFDLDAGIDWYTRLDKNQKDKLINDLKILIIQTYGVMKITSLTVTQDAKTRGAVLSYSVDTIYSQSFIRSLALASGEVGN